MTTCVDCGRTMRPYRARVEDHPGTTTRGSTNRCRTCLRHAYADSDTEPEHRAPSRIWLPIEEADWMTNGLCAQTDPEAYYPEKGESTRVAKRICNGDPKRGIDPCPVRAQCLEYALDAGERFGIWGGLSEPERRKLRRFNAAA